MARLSYPRSCQQLPEHPKHKQILEVGLRPRVVFSETRNRDARVAGYDCNAALALIRPRYSRSKPQVPHPYPFSPKSGQQTVVANV